MSLRQKLAKKPAVLKQVQERIGSSNNWPWAIKRVVYEKTHMSNPERFKVIVFFYVNGMPPYEIRWFFQELYGFDEEGWRHVNWVIDNVQTKVLNNKWHAWDMTARQSSHLYRRGIHIE